VHTGAAPAGDPFTTLIKNNNSDMPKKILVTGIAGMIGSHLLDTLLEKGYIVTGIDNLSYGSLSNIRHNLSNPNFRFHRVDVTELDLMKILAKDADIIVHLAAFKKIGEKDSAMPTFNTNGKGTENVFEVAKMWGCKVVFASTSDVYGMSPVLPLREDGDIFLGPSMIKRWSYAVSKLYGEQMAFAYHHDYGVPVTIVRYFGGFSPRSSFAWSGGHIPIFIRAILNGDEVIVHGDGSQTRSMGFVTDLVNGTVLAMESEKALGQIINIGNDEEMSVVDSARLIHRIIGNGKELRIKYVPMQEVFGNYKDIMRRIPDLSKAKSLLGYEPKVRIEEAVRLTVKEINKTMTEKTV
jgi:UDP-glucose 4-epimerase